MQAWIPNWIPTATKAALHGAKAVRRWAWGAALAACAVVLVDAVLGARSARDTTAARTTRWVAPGVSFDGVALGPLHPLRRRVDLRDGVEPLPSSAGAAARPAASLHVRRHCAWGQPGRDPYRGTAEEALTLAQLPAEVVLQLVADIRAGRAADRVTIDNAAVRAARSGREFDPRSIAMTYGRTLCLDTWVNFVAGHTEGADLYEATGADGRRYAVMVPDVCGNVSLLAERRALPAAAWAGATPAHQPTAVGAIGVGDTGRRSGTVGPGRLRQLPFDLIDADDDGRAHALGVAFSNTVPEPATSILVVTALLLAAGVRRRR